MSIIKYKKEIPITVVNGGGSDTTDWIDTNTDGLGDNWSKVNNAATTDVDIVTSFLGFDRAQRVTITGTGNYATIRPDSISGTLIVGNKYRLIFDYATDSNKFHLRYGMPTYLPLAATKTTYIYEWTANDTRFNFEILLPDTIGAFFIVDNIYLIDLNNFNTILRNGRLLVT